MSRASRGALTFVVVGTVAWVWVHDRASHIGIFFFLFFGGIAGLLAAMGARGESNVGPVFENDESGSSNSEQEERPFVDRLGMHRFQGDVLDTENHPGPGANGWVGERAGLTSAFGDQRSAAS